jgi:protein-tyrosine phosphatase
MSKILDRFYLGDRLSAYNQNFIAQNKINVIVNATKDIPNFYDSIPEIKYYRMPIEDNLEVEELNAFYFYAKSLLPILYKEYKEGKVILIHCFAGMQRSAALALLFLIYYHKKENNINMSVGDAKFYILSKRPVAFKYGMYMNFEPSVNLIANEIYNNQL